MKDDSDDDEEAKEDHLYRQPEKDNLVTEALG